MKISHFPVSIRSILAVNLAVWMIAAAALTVMLLAGALSSGAVDPLGAPAEAAADAETIEVEVLDSAVVETIEVEVLDSAVVATPDVAVETQVSSVAIVRVP